MIFVDTSAILPLLNREDLDHGHANDVLRRHLDAGEFITHNYVVVETMALLQRRFGLAIVRAFVEGLQPLMKIVWIDSARHERAARGMLAGGRRTASLVDRVSFDLMRELGIRTAFAYDADFRREGFRLLR